MKLDMRIIDCAQTEGMSENVCICHGSSKGSGYHFGVQSQWMRFDMRIIGCAQTEGVARKIANVLKVMHACVRLGRGGTSLVAERSPRTRQVEELREASCLRDVLQSSE